MFDESWSTTEVYYAFPTGVKYEKPVKPWRRDCIRYETITLRLMFCSPKAHNKILKEFPFLKEIPKRPPQCAPYVPEHEFRCTEINTPKFERLRILIPRLKEIYARLLMAGASIQWE